MRLLELCLASILAPQDPSTTPASSPPPAPPAAAASAPSANEVSGDDAGELAALAMGEDPAVAARAAWALGSGKHRVVLPALLEVAVKSPHPAARRHALQALLRFQDTGSTATAIEALRDEDRTVRTLAVQLLTRLKRPAALQPLLAMFEAARAQCEPGPATDLQAALLCLSDLGAADRLLQVATALHDSAAEDTGTALAWCCQTLAPKLPREQQITLATALLSHRELLVRRWAIGHLAELDEPATAKALEGRLPLEGKELRPLVELALAQVRRDQERDPTASDELQRAKQNLEAIGGWLAGRWRQLTPTEQIASGAGALAVLAIVVLALWRRRIAARERAATRTIALVQPSADHVEQQELDRASTAWAAAQAEVEGEALTTDEAWPGDGELQPAGTEESVDEEAADVAPRR
jgi:hypothetical protein